MTTLSGTCLAFTCAQVKSWTTHRDVKVTSLSGQSNRATMRDVAALAGRQPEDGVAGRQRRARRLPGRPRAGHRRGQPARLPPQPGREQPAPHRRPHRAHRRARPGPVELVLRQPAARPRGLRPPSRHRGARGQPRRGGRPRAGARPRPRHPPGRRAGHHAGQRAPGLPRHRAAHRHAGRLRRPPPARRRRRLGHRRQPPRWRGWRPSTSSPRATAGSPRSSTCRRIPTAARRLAGFIDAFAERGLRPTPGSSSPTSGRRTRRPR